MRGERCGNSLTSSTVTLQTTDHSTDRKGRLGFGLRLGASTSNQRLRNFIHHVRLVLAGTRLTLRVVTYYGKRHKYCWRELVVASFRYKSPATSKAPVTLDPSVLIMIGTGLGFSRMCLRQIRVTYKISSLELTILVPPSLP